jgi:hypothetical protein
MQTLDLIKQYQSLYLQPKNSVSIVEVPKFNFLRIDGKGNPNNNPDYSDALGALYSVAYTLKFAVKKGPLQVDYKVMPLEGLWWTEDMSEFTLNDRGNWLWRMMIMLPDLITAEMVRHSIEEARKKKNPPRLNDVMFESFEEGLAAQVFHLGPYGEAERPSVEKLHSFIKDNGYTLRAKHHEIYFNSPLRTDPSRLKTIIRQPIEKI